MHKITKQHMKKKEKSVLCHWPCIMYYNAKGTYSLNVQVDKAGSKGKENVTDHVFCVRIQGEWKVTYLLNKSDA